MPARLLLTCEHGGRRVPARYRACFRGAERALASHRGHDLGALGVARWLARELGAPLLGATTTRLLVDLNRSANHPHCLSSYVAELPAAERERIFAEHYWPHRRAVEGALHELHRGGARVLHVAVHSFTPVLCNVRRSADVGLLYDPARRWESELAARWRGALRGAGDWRVRSNYPYRGTSDGLATALRRAHPATRYAGIELELNQRVFRPGTRTALPTLRRTLATTLQELLEAS